MYKVKELRFNLLEIYRSLLKRNQDLGLLITALRVGYLLSTLKGKSSTLEQLRKQLLLLPNILGRWDYKIVKNNRLEAKFDHHEVLSKDSLYYKNSHLYFGRGLPCLSDKGVILRRLLEELFHRYCTQWGFDDVYCPGLIKAKHLISTGQFPKFKDEVVGLSWSIGMYLSPTGEVQLGNLHVNSERMLTTLTRCYRPEVPYGRASRGLIRNVEFEKRELFVYSLPYKSWSYFRLMLLMIGNLLDKFKLTYRAITLSANEMAFQASSTVDFEVLLHSEKRWLEVSSCSNCTDFQSKRIPLRWKVKGETIHPHTLNGSCLPIGRVMVCLISYYGLDESINLIRSFL